MSSLYFLINAFIFMCINCNLHAQQLSQAQTIVGENSLSKRSPLIKENAVHINEGYPSMFQNLRKPLSCPFYGPMRTPEKEELSNCTWYEQYACCRRTEVQEVFKNAKQWYPKLHASETCSRMLSYLMCYFCSPVQSLFFDSNGMWICRSFCDNLFKNCMDASVIKSEKNESFSSLWHNGSEFCAANGFRVYEGRNRTRCFDYDADSIATAREFGTHLSSNTRTLSALHPLVCSAALLTITFRH